MNQANDIIINRKVADVKREKELAERRKNEPQLGSSQDHLVRKIFSKFRRAQQTAQLTKDGSQNSDVEKGDTDQESKKVRNFSNNGRNWIPSYLLNTLPTQLPAKLTLSEDSRIVTSVPSPSASPSPTSHQQQQPAATSTTVAVVSARGPRPGSKWGRLLGSSSVDSGSDNSAKVNVSRSLSARDGLRDSAAQSRAAGGAQGSNGQGNKVNFSLFLKTPQ